MAAAVSTVSANNLTILELARRVSLTPDGFIEIAEVLNRSNAIMQDATWIEANQKLSHINTIRNSLPVGQFKSFYGSITPERSTTKQVTEQVGMLKAYSDIDADEAKISGDVTKFRDAEDRAFLEGLMQTFVQTVFYGSLAAIPESFNGMGTRLNANAIDYSTTRASIKITDAGRPIKVNVTGASTTNGQTGQTGNLTSIYIVDWNPQRMTLVYPTGPISGMVKTTDKGQLSWPSVSSAGVTLGVREAFITYFEISGGISVRDSRSMWRIANIDPTKTGAPYIFQMQQVFAAISQILRIMPNAGTTAAIYGNADFLAMCDTYMDQKPVGSATSLNYAEGSVGNLRVMNINGVPAKLCEQLISNELLIT